MGRVEVFIDLLFPLHSSNDFTVMPNLDLALLYQSTELSFEFPHESFIFMSVTDEYLYFVFHDHLLNSFLILENLALKVTYSILVLLSIVQFNHIINMIEQHFECFKCHDVINIFPAERYGKI